MLEADNEYGLGDYLSGAVDLHAAIQPTSIANLYLLSGGSGFPNAANLLKSARMRDLAGAVKNEFDVILFDCTPILGVSDASIVISLVDACLLVVQHRRFPRAMLLRVKNALNGLNATVLGVVLNNVDARHDQQYRFYTGYSDYSKRVAKNRKPKQKADAKQRSETKSSVGGDEY